MTPTFSCPCGRQHKLSPLIRHHYAEQFLLTCDCGALWSTMGGVTWLIRAGNAAEEGAER